MDNYEQLGKIIRQKNVNKIAYNYDYSNQYNGYGERAKYLSYLRLGVLLGNINKIPKSILDVGYGNCDFLNAAKERIKMCYGYDISEYPLSDGLIKADTMCERHYDVICFFDSLEHFDEIDIIKNLQCDYVFISVPWCHNFCEDWFLKWYHRKPDEHLWHFNKEALWEFFQNNGYECIHISNFEDFIRNNSESQYYPNILSCIFKKKHPIEQQLYEFYRDKRILVTGGTGFIGSNIVEGLLDYDVAKITVFDRTIKKTFYNPFKITYIQGDLLHDIEKLDEIEFDVCFHEAANVDTTCTDADNMMSTNFQAFVNLINICEKKHARLIYASSAAVYGNSSHPNRVGTDESPLNIYGESKLAMDKYVQNYQGDISITGLRYFNVYGPGEDHKNNMRSMVKQMMDKIHEGRDVELFEFGEQKRDFVYVKDVVRCNLLAGMKNITGIFNCSHGVSVSFNEIYKIIYSYFRNDTKLVYIKNKYDFFQNNTLADMTETKSQLEFVCKYNIVEGIYHYMSNSSKSVLFPELLRSSPTQRVSKDSSNRLF